MLVHSDGCLVENCPAFKTRYAKFEIISRQIKKWFEVKKHLPDEESSGSEVTMELSLLNQ